MNKKRKNFGKDLIKRKKIAIPYSLKETLSWFYRYNKGPSSKNKENIQYILSGCVLNKIKPKYSLIFIGDIMELKERDLIISNSVKQYIKSGDYLIGNFEGTITEEKRIFFDQRHKIQILDAIESLFTPNKIYLSVANNHGGDFGRKAFFDSVSQLEQRGFTIFGTKRHPFVDLNDQIRVIAGTMWTNRPCNYLTNFYDAEKFLKSTSFNVFFPHWGYELCFYPNRKIVRTGKDYLAKFDAMIGHHSHIPQPVFYEKFNGTNKLIAYSLGDFSYGDEVDRRDLRNYKYGTVLKINIGKDLKGSLKVGRVEWKFIESKPISNDEFVVEFLEEIPIF